MSTDYYVKAGFVTEHLKDFPESPQLERRLIDSDGKMAQHFVIGTRFAKGRGKMGFIWNLPGRAFWENLPKDIPVKSLGNDLKTKTLGDLLQATAELDAEEAPAVSELLRTVSRYNPREQLIIPHSTFHYFGFATLADTLRAIFTPSEGMNVSQALRSGKYINYSPFNILPPPPYSKTTGKLVAVKRLQLEDGMHYTVEIELTGQSLLHPSYCLPQENWTLDPSTVLKGGEPLEIIDATGNGLMHCVEIRSNGKLLYVDQDALPKVGKIVYERPALPFKPSDFSAFWVIKPGIPDSVVKTRLEKRLITTSSQN